MARTTSAAAPLETLSPRRQIRGGLRRGGHGRECRRLSDAQATAWPTSDPQETLVISGLRSLRVRAGTQPPILEPGKITEALASVFPP